MHAYNMFIDDKLSSVDKMAESIQIPKIYGSFEDDQHYLATLDLLLAATNETENRNQFFLKNILPYVNSDSMLDVGLGDGKLTALAGKQFQEITLIDPSWHALKKTETHPELHHKKIKSLVGSIENINLATDQFDLAILSHTLYYIDHSLWLPVVIKILSALKQNGLLVIVLNGGLDKDTAAVKFGGQPLAIDQFIEHCCTKLNVNSIDISYSPVYFKTFSLQAMQHIAGLHLYDVGAKATSDELAEYLQQNQDFSRELYQFILYQKFIVIRK